MLDKIKIGKRGGEKYLSIWWFLILGVIALGIVAGVLIYYSGEVDIRQNEANALSEKILNCVNNNGFLIDSFSESFDIFSECGLDKNMFSSDSYFYFNLSVRDEKNSVIGSESIGGNMEYPAYCSMKKKQNGKEAKAGYYPKCMQVQESVLYLKDGNVKIGKIILLTASNQQGNKLTTKS